MELREDSPYCTPQQNGVNESKNRNGEIRSIANESMSSFWTKAHTVLYKKNRKVHRKSRGLYSNYG